MSTATIDRPMGVVAVMGKKPTKKQIEQAKQIVLEEGKLYSTVVERVAVCDAINANQVERFQIVREGGKEDGAVTGVIIKRLVPADGWKTIGQVGVDAGMLMLCDPCYIVGYNKPEDPNDPLSKFPRPALPTAFDKNWMDFCDSINSSYTQLNYDKGHAGLGVVFDSGLGDGAYDVDAKFKGGRVQEIRVKFFSSK